MAHFDQAKHNRMIFRQCLLESLATVVGYALGVIVTAPPVYFYFHWLGLL